MPTYQVTFMDPQITPLTVDTGVAADLDCIDIGMNVAEHTRHLAGSSRRYQCEVGKSSGCLKFGHDGKEILFRIDQKEA